MKSPRQLDTARGLTLLPFGSARRNVHHNGAKVGEALENGPVQYAEVDQGLPKGWQRIFGGPIVQLKEQPNPFTVVCDLGIGQDASIPDVGGLGYKGLPVHRMGHVQGPPTEESGSQEITTSYLSIHVLNIRLLPDGSMEGELAFNFVILGRFGENNLVVLANVRVYHACWLVCVVWFSGQFGSV
jgi:hypothetical protein